MQKQSNAFERSVSTAAHTLLLLLIIMIIIINHFYLTHTEQIGALRFVVAFLLFCLSSIGVDPELAIDVGPEFVLTSLPSNVP